MKMVRSFKTLIFLLLLSASVSAQTEKSRLIVLADMGNEPDEEQQMIQLLMYSNVIDIDGLISVTGLYIQPGNVHPYRRVVHPELFHKLIDGYEKVYHNLHRHAKGWMSPFKLRTMVASGQPEYGMAGVGEGKSSEGSDWIIYQVTTQDPRPVFVVINAGSNTLAQALFDYRKNHTPEELDAFVAKLRVYENAGQDNAGAWINHEFPRIHWIRGIHQTKNFGGYKGDDLGPHVWKPYPGTAKGQDDWAHEHIRTGHGPLGELYPIRLYGNHDFDSPASLGGGGIIPWMSLVTFGLTDPSKPSWGGWSGRYTVEKVANVPARIPEVRATEKQYEPWAVYTDAIDHWVDPETGIEYNDQNAGIWPWRLAMWNDLQARMDWCVKTYDKANHHPVAVINGNTGNTIIHQTAKTGETLNFNASGSTDPDGDSLTYKWWIYPEAGRKPYGKKLPISNADYIEINFTVPSDAKGKELHLILEVWDDSEIVKLPDYRRVVITVSEN